MSHEIPCRAFGYLHRRLENLVPIVFPDPIHYELRELGRCVSALVRRIHGRPHGI